MKKHLFIPLSLLLFGVAILITGLGVLDYYVWGVIVLAQLCAAIAATQYFQKI